MPGPIDTTRFVHNAIVKEADEIEAATNATTDATELAALADRIEWFGYVVNKHTTGEEVGLFPPLAERRPSIADTYLFDHVDERALFPELTQLARDASTGKPDSLARLQRQSIALTEHLHAHVRKENELIFPLVNELFSPPEQGEMVGKMIADLTPEDNVIAMPWIVRMNDADGAAVYVDALSHVMPPPVFDMAKGWIRDGVSAERWTELTQRVPALG